MPWYLLQEPILGRGQAEDAFGWAMTTLDVNGDQRAELAVSAPGVGGRQCFYLPLVARRFCRRPRVVAIGVTTQLQVRGTGQTMVGLTNYS